MKNSEKMKDKYFISCDNYSECKSRMENFDNNISNYPKKNLKNPKRRIVYCDDPQGKLSSHKTTNKPARVGSLYHKQTQFNGCYLPFISLILLILAQTAQ